MKPRVRAKARPDKCGNTGQSVAENCCKNPLLAGNLWENRRRMKLAKLCKYSSPAENP
jgi:hypothetical protein